MKNVYRLNVRFDCADTEQKELVEKIQSLDRLQHGSINSFVIEAIRKRFESAEQTQILVETLRQVLREELQGMAFEIQSQSNAAEAPDNADEVASVMETLAMFD